MEFSVRIPIYDAVTVMQVPSRSPSPVPSPAESPASRFSVVSSHDQGAGSPPESNMTTWEMWDTIRTICGYNPRLTLSQYASHERIFTAGTNANTTALDLTPPLPLSSTVLNQWLAEPVRYLWLPASTFIANAKGYPVLPKGTQSFIRDIFKVSSCASFLIDATLLTSLD